MKNSTFELLAPIAATAQSGARFASFDYTAKGSGERARHTVILGVNVERAYKRDLAMLKRELPRLSGVAAVACQELISSLSESLEKGIGNNSAYTCADVFTPVCKGVKIHKETGAMHVFGFAHGKKVLEAGTFAKVKSSEKTLAKNELRKRMKSGKFRQFALSELNGARMAGKVLEFT